MFSKCFCPSRLIGVPENIFGDTCAVSRFRKRDDSFCFLMTGNSENILEKKKPHHPKMMGLMKNMEVVYEIFQ